MGEKMYVPAFLVLPFNLIKKPIIPECRMAGGTELYNGNCK